MTSPILDLATVQAVYRAAIDAGAHDAEGTGWWPAVSQEVSDVVAAPHITAAAAVIAWWHLDWTAIGDTPAQAARRLRQAAARLGRCNGTASQPAQHATKKRGPARAKTGLPPPTAGGSDGS